MLSSKDQTCIPLCRRNQHLMWHSLSLGYRECHSPTRRIFPFFKESILPHSGYFSWKAHVYSILDRLNQWLHGFRKRWLQFCCGLHWVLTWILLKICSLFNDSVEFNPYFQLTLYCKKINWLIGKWSWSLWEFVCWLDSNIFLFYW